VPIIEAILSVGSAGVDCTALADEVSDKTKTKTKATPGSSCSADDPDAALARADQECCSGDAGNLRGKVLKAVEGM
jgi:hypothetical protein